MQDPDTITSKIHVQDSAGQVLRRTWIISLSEKQKKMLHTTIFNSYIQSLKTPQKNAGIAQGWCKTGANENRLP